jgi:hypothetical protein
MRTIYEGARFEAHSPSETFSNESVLVTVAVDGPRLSGAALTPSPCL